MHSLTYELGWRTLDHSRSASNALRQQAGHSIKSSAAHVFRVDNFADPARASDGTGFRCDQGLGLRRVLGR